MMRYAVWSFIVFFASGLMFSCGGGGGNGSSSTRTEFSKITASDAEVDDSFGRSVSISGDYAIVGAYGEDSKGIDAGAAYIYYRNQGGADVWGEVVKLTASDAEADDSLGWSVSISGDYAIVGAPNENVGGIYAGAAYIYYRNQGGADAWGEVVKITASDAEAIDQFGISVSISDDNAIVGAIGEDTAADRAGAAYIYNRNQGGADIWGEVVKLTASDAEAEDWFGTSVSIDGDKAIVGAGDEDAGGNNAGAAYIYYRNQGGADAWGEVVKITASDAEESDWFGYAVSLGGDYVIVGASGEDSGEIDAGAAYIYYRNQGGADVWGEVVKLTASNVEVDDSFGVSVSITNDKAIVGAYREDSGGTDAGAAYIYYRNQGGADAWGEVVKLTASDADPDDFLGRSVSMSGDLAIVGAPHEDAEGSEAGAVYIY